MPYPKGKSHPNKGQKGLQGKNKTTFKKGTIPWNKNKKNCFSEESKNKMSNTRKLLFKEGIIKPTIGELNGMYGKNGHLNPNWKGGISFEEYCPIFSDKEWRQMIYERDGNCCRFCGITNNLSLKVFERNLSIHHIDYDKQNCDPMNCITVCLRCNAKANFNRSLYQFIYSWITISREFNISLEPYNLKELIGFIKET